MEAFPKSYYISRSDVMRATGVSNGQLSRMVKCGALRRVVLPGCKYGKYLRREIVSKFKLKEER